MLSRGEGDRGDRRAVGVRWGRAGDAGARSGARPRGEDAGGDGGTGLPTLLNQLLFLSARLIVNETQVGLAVPEGVQHLLRRTVGHRRAERMLLVGAMLEAREAHAVGMIDALATPGDTEAAAFAWLQSLEDLPRAPMLATRALSRADMVDALAPGRLDIDQPLRDWWHADTQHALRALLARLGKG